MAKKELITITHPGYICYQSVSDFINALAHMRTRDNYSTRALKLCVPCLRQVWICLRCPHSRERAAFHGYFVVSNRKKRLRILPSYGLAVTWSMFILYRAHPNAGYVVLG